MNNEELNVYLYQKILAEFNEFKNELSKLNSLDILENVDEYIIKRNIVDYLYDNDISTEEVNALWNSPTPLNDIFCECIGTEAEFRHFSYIKNSIYKAADKRIRKNLNNKITDATYRSEHSSKNTGKGYQQNNEHTEVEKYER